MPGEARIQGRSVESVEEYQRKQEGQRFMKRLVAGLRDIESDQVVDGEDFFQVLKSRVLDGKCGNTCCLKLNISLYFYQTKLGRNADGYNQRHGG